MNAWLGNVAKFDGWELAWILCLPSPDLLPKVWRVMEKELGWDVVESLCGGFVDDCSLCLVSQVFIVILMKCLTRGQVAVFDQVVFFFTSQWFPF